MSDITKDEFEKMKNLAAEQVMAFHKRNGTVPISNYAPPPKNTSPTPPITASEEDPPPLRRSSPAASLMKYLNFSEMLKNGDSLLLLGLIFLLSAEDADETLVLALAYILL